LKSHNVADSPADSNDLHMLDLANQLEEHTLL
jgi:hypothetical protein